MLALQAECKAQGAEVARLKDSGAAKEEITAAVTVLKKLKADVTLFFHFNLSLL